MNDREINELLKSIRRKNPASPPELIQTHISWVILAGDRAWKIKKPMRYAFLDFSTQEARAEYCRRELELNRRQAPHMYLGLAQVCRTDGHLEIAQSCSEGELLDHAVEMKRMTEANRLDRLMDAGKVPAGRGAGLARQVAEFHREAAVITDPVRSSVSGYREDFGDLLSVRDDFGRHLGTEAARRLDRVLAEGLEWLDGRESLLRRRLDGGWVRDLHGDLHTRNIFMEADEFVVFDCIEFNDAFRQIDVLSEIAFLYMDVEVRGMSAFGEAFLEAYLREIPAMEGDEDRALFNYFRRYRANVRAKVNALRSRQAKGKELDQAVGEMEVYLGLMERIPLSAG